jgi:hypothetical protein
MTREVFIKEVKRFLLTHCLTSLFITVSLGFLVWRWVDFAYGQTTCPVGVTRHAPHEITHETCPAIAKMNGVKLAIPQHYLLGPKGYKGVDIWNAESYKKRPEIYSFDNELDNFAIKIRLTNFKPIETFIDRESYSTHRPHIGPYPPEKRWIHVGIKALDPKNTVEATFKQTVQRWLKDDAERGPFLEQPEIFGLTRYLSTQTARPFVHKNEFLHDPEFSIFATCEHIVQISVPHEPRINCELNFRLPDLHASINIDGFTEFSDLARWSEIKLEISKIIHNFIVP